MDRETEKHTWGCETPGEMVGPLREKVGVVHG